MADNAYDRTPVYPLEKPLADDVDQGFSQVDRSLRDTMFQLLGGVSGFLRQSLEVVPQTPAALGVTIKTGIGFQDAPTDVPANIGGTVGVNDMSRYKPIVLTADLNVAVPAPPGANSRIDLIEVRYNRQLDNSQSRNFLNPSTSAFAPALVAKTLDFTVDGTLAYYAAAATPTTALAYKSGVAAVSPVAPTTDMGYIALAYVTVASGAVTIVAANIEDRRPATSQGLFLGRQIFTANGTYVPTPGTTHVKVRMVGGGGGGGGAAATGAGNVAVGGGGASGTYLEDILANSGRPVIGGAVVIGTGGAGGVGGAPGSNGVATTIVINGTTFTAAGGNGGSESTGAAPQIGAGGVASATAADVQGGGHGGYGVGLGNTWTAGGIGGANPLGPGGYGAFNGAGSNGLSYGSGGGGAARHESLGAANGGDGAAGYVIVEEWG